MDPRELQNNEELVEYLAHLGEILKKSGRPKLMATIIRASRFGVGSASEFLHEVQLALESVERDLPSALSDGDLQDVIAVRRQVQGAFRSIGGA